MTTPVWFLTLPGVMTLDLTGPAETLKLAGNAFSLRYIGPDESVLTSTEMVISRIEPLPEALPAGSLLVIPASVTQKCGSTRRRRWQPATG